MKRFIYTLAEKLRSNLIQPPMRIGWPRPHLPLVLLASMAPFVLSGPIRTITTLSMSLSLLAALVVCMVVAFLFRQWLRPNAVLPRTSTGWTSEVLPLVIGGLAVLALYKRDFGGFMNLDGWDGGSHVLIKDQFATLAPGMYNGQVSYYALTWWLERLFRIDAFRSFTIVFYLVVASVSTLPLIIAFAVIRGFIPSKTLPRVVALFVVVLGMAGVLLAVVLPLLHYNAAAGYYVHIFGLVPLMTLWVADSQIRSPRVRLAVLICLFVLLRYTYALNLADAAIAMSAIVLFECFKGWWRILQVALVVGLAATAFRIVEEILPIFRVWGGMQGFDMLDLLRADLLLAGGILAYVIASLCKMPPRLWLDSRLFRAVRFPVLFGFASSALFFHFRQGRGVQYYYLMKYQMWACILLSFALAIVAAHLSCSLVRWAVLRSPVVWMRAILVIGMLISASGLCLKTFAGYRTTMQERILPNGPPYKYLRPLVDVEAIERIKVVLSGEHKAFGGYLTAFFPMFSFMNATLGYHLGRQEFFPPATTPGHCVFWVSKAHDIYRLGPADGLDVLRNQVATAGFNCSEYTVPWKSTPQSLCYHCY